MRTLGVDARLQAPYSPDRISATTSTPEYEWRVRKSVSDTKQTTDHKNAPQQNQQLSRPPELIPDADRERWLKALREYGKPPQPEPEQISPNEAAYRHFTNPKWISLEEVERRAAEEYRKRNPPNFLGTCGDFM